MNHMTINGASYAVEAYQEKTSLPWLLMLHGFMGDGRVFHPLIDRLSEFCNPVTVDLLGHGQTEKIYDPERYKETRQISDIIELTRRIDRSPIFLYGYSMGGRLALKTALTAPQMFAGLILESTTYGIADKTKRMERRESDKKRAQDIKKDFEAFLNNWEKLSLFQAPQPADNHPTERYKQIQQSQDPDAMAASLLGFGTGSMDPVLEQLSDYSRPALLLVGSADEKYIDINDTMVRLFDDAQKRRIEAGHRVHLDNPKALVQELNHFIAKHSLL